MTPESVRVLAISLHNQPWFDEMYAPLLRALRSKWNFSVLKTQPQPFGSYHNIQNLQPYSSQMKPCHCRRTMLSGKPFWGSCIVGGKAIVMGLFPSFVQPASMKPFFSPAGLPWGAGSYHQTTLSLNQAVVGVADVEKLPQRYSQKAVFANNVAPGDMWYKTDDGSMIQSMVLRYVGGVNAEDGVECGCPCHVRTAVINRHEKQLCRLAPEPFSLLVWRTAMTPIRPFQIHMYS